MDLFTASQSHTNQNGTPLAERLRPAVLSDFVGQESGRGGWLALRWVLSGEGLPTNMIFWGPPGTGKTSLARLISEKVAAKFVAINAVDSGAKELRAIGEDARLQKLHYGKPTILFVDEVHRLNKGQQDVLLPFSERGDFILIGATTENPSYEINQALLSRCQVLNFSRLSEEALTKILIRALAIGNFKIDDIFTPDGMAELFAMSDGDARRMLNHVEMILSLRSANRPEVEFPLKSSALRELLEVPTFGYQRSGDDHYDCISAFIKSVRGSDPQAAVYYLARMLKSGEDPVFIARRLVILASEDVGNADPQGLVVAASGLQAVELVGMPEAAITLAHVTTYLASTPKSNASYLALRKAQEVVEKTGRLEIPLSLRSARTSLAKTMGYGEGYRYSHEGPEGFIKQDFLPDNLKEMVFYEPKNIGYEEKVKIHLNKLFRRGSEPSGSF